MTTRTPEELEEKLHYHFKNKELLITALTHSSYANESKTPTLYNERLEFLGDSVPVSYTHLTLPTNREV